MATWVDLGPSRSVVDGTGKVTSSMRIIAPVGIFFPVADEAATPLFLRAFINNVYSGHYVTIAQCEAAIELIIG